MTGAAFFPVSVVNLAGFFGGEGGEGSWDGLDRHDVESGEPMKERDREDCEKDLVTRIGLKMRL